MSSQFMERTVQELKNEIAGYKSIVFVLLWHEH